MGIKSRHLWVLAFSGMLAGPTSAFATNGYFLIGYGAGAIGVGGASVAFPQDAIAGAANPANIGEFTSPQFDVGIGFFEPRRRSGVDIVQPSIVSNPSNDWSDVNLFAIPSMGFVWPFNENLSVGLAAVGAGMNTKYRNNFFQNSSGTATKYLGVDLVQLFVPITASYKINNTHTLGMSVVPARQRFAAIGLRTFEPFSSDGDHLTDKGHDYANGLGFRFGWMGHFQDNKLSLGATYATKVYMQKFKLYRGLFAEAGSFDVPVNYAVGMAYKLNKDLTFAFDIQRILYSGVPSVGNRGPYVGAPDSFNTPPPTGEFALGNDHGLGFGWKDMTVYKMGVAYKYSDKLTLRAGYNYGKNPIPQDQLLFSAIAPGTVEKHYTLGLTYNLGEQSIFGFGREADFTMAYVHAQAKRLQGPTPYNTYADYELYQNELEFASSLKF